MVITKMKLFSRGLCLLAMLLSVGVLTAVAEEETAAAQAPAASEEAVVAEEAPAEAVEETLEQGELNARMKFFAAIDADAAQARELQSKKEFDEAEKLLLAAKAQLEEKNYSGSAAKSRMEKLDAQIGAFYKAWSSDVMSKAQKSKRDGKYEDAIGFAARAGMLDASRSKEVEKFVADCRARQKSTAFSRETAIETLKPRKADDDMRKAQLVREARVYYKNSKYEEAIKALEQAQLIDKFDTEIIFFLQQAYAKLITVGESRRRLDSLTQRVYELGNWMNPVFSSGVDRSSLVTETKTQSGDAIARMERIVFPSIEFEEADFMSVVRFFNSRSRSYDPENIGVIIATAIDADTLNRLPKISMSFNNMPMSEALRYLCKQVGLEYRSDGNDVIVGQNFGAMQLSYFTVRGDFINSIGAIDGNLKIGASEMGSTSGGKGVDLNTLFDSHGSSKGSATTQTSISSEGLKQYFAERGVPFPEGSQISYEPLSSRLSVRNTPENIRRMDELLRQLDKIATPLVMVEVKVVEIRENDWQELGFDWAFSIFTDVNNPSKPSLMGGDNTTGAPTNSYWPLPMINSPNRNGSIGANTNTYPSNWSESNIKVVNDLQIFPNLGKGLFGPNSQVNMALSINAVDRNGRTETLSAPKVITISGRKALVKMTRQYYFPTSWQAPTVNTTDNYTSVTAPIPNFSSTPTDIGIMMEVTPTVSADNYTIVLNLKPEITQYLGPTDDFVNVYQGYPGGAAIYSVDYNVWMPQIYSRKMEVMAKVYDGETIVIGGMVESRHEALDDRYPVLGDVPLLGRLFSSQYDKTTKVNMLLFVTARLINNDGEPIRKSVARGIPDIIR